jgi:hypothetical protein
LNLGFQQGLMNPRDSSTGAANDYLFENWHNQRNNSDPQNDEQSEKYPTIFGYASYRNGRFGIFVPKKRGALIWCTRLSIRKFVVVVTSTGGVSRTSGLPGAGAKNPAK